MKDSYSKSITPLLAGLLAGLLTVSTLTACGGNQASESSTATGLADTALQDTSISDDTQAPLIEELDTATAAVLLSEAVAASQAQTNYKTVERQTLGFDDTAQMDVTVLYGTDGSAHHLSTNAMGMDLTYLLIGDIAYVIRSIPTESEKFAVTLTEEQKQALLSGAGSVNTFDSSMLLSPDAYLSLEGYKETDGSYTLTAPDLSDTVKEALGANENTVITVSSCTLSINADKLIEELALSYTLTVLETDFTAAMSMNGSVTRSTAYSGITLAPPEDATDYLKESYAAVFEGSVPLESVMQAAGMPLTGNDYVIGDPSTGASLEAQLSLLTQFPHLYAGKAFTLQGRITTDAFFCDLIIGDTSLALDCSQEVLGPLTDDVISVNAEFCYGLSGSETNLSNYYFYFESYELLERPAGPNGGTLMFVDVNSTLNVRPQPSTSGNTPLTSLARGEIVEVLDIIDGWAKIVFEDAASGYAYVSAQYLSES